MKSVTLSRDAILPNSVKKEYEKLSCDTHDENTCMQCLVYKKPLDETTIAWIKQNYYHPEPSTHCSTIFCRRPTYDEHPICHMCDTVCVNYHLAIDVIGDDYARTAKVSVSTHARNVL